MQFIARDQHDAALTQRLFAPVALDRAPAGQDEDLVLPLVLVALVIGSLVVLPSLRFVSSSLKAGEVIKTNEKGIYAATAGIEQGLFRIKADWADWSPVGST